MFFEILTIFRNSNWPNSDLLFILLFLVSNEVMLSKANDTSFLKSTLAYVRLFMCIYDVECTFLNTRFWIAF